MLCNLGCRDVFVLVGHRSFVFVVQRWIDEYLRWDPAKFGGLELITLPWDKVWVPDIVLVNT